MLNKKVLKKCLKKFYKLKNVSNDNDSSKVLCKIKENKYCHKQENSTIKEPLNFQTNVPFNLQENVMSPDVASTKDMS